MLHQHLSNDNILHHYRRENRLLSARDHGWHHPSNLHRRANISIPRAGKSPLVLFLSNTNGPEIECGREELRYRTEREGCVGLRCVGSLPPSHPLKLSSQRSGQNELTSDNNNKK